VSGEKNKPPTRRRLQEARKEGQVAQTPSIPSLLAAAGTFELLMATRDLWLGQIPLLLGTFIQKLGHMNLTTRLDVKDLLIPLGGLGLVAALAVLLFASLMALIGNVAQTGFMIAPEGVARLDRLNPIEHAKQMVTREQLMMLAMNTVKLTIIVGCTGLALLMSIDSVLRMANGTLVHAVETLMNVLALCERLALLALIVLVAIDWVIRKQAHIKSLRMSHEEVEQEMKDHYGNKHVRRQRWEMRQDMLMGQLSEGTRKSNAVVTNPTHFAVALLYNPAKYPLPIVMARGADFDAAWMREVARQANIPVIRSAQLARTLYSVGRVKQPVPHVALKGVAAVYRVVAEITTGKRRIDDVPDLSKEEPPPGE
jgi:type III secretion protein U